MRVPAITAERVTLRKVGVFVVLTLLGALAVPATAGAKATQPGDVVADRVLVKFAPGTSTAAKAAARSAVGATKITAIPQLGVEVLKVPNAASATALARLQRQPNVVFAEPDGIVRGDEVLPNDPQWPNQWGLRKVAAPTAWTTTTGSTSVTIAVLDTGVDATHPDLKAALLPGRDFINNDADPTDDNGHGTKSAGVAAARSNNATGVAGGCWTCAVLPVKVLGSDSTGSWSAVANGITWATDQGARVISMSLSGSSGSSTLQSAVRYAHDRGVVLLASAGNVGDTAVRYPSGYDEVIAVAGSDSADNRYSWSTHGSWVELAAPGCNPTTVKGGTYGTFCGTSSATPMVSGIAGLLASAGATRAQIESALTSTAVPVSYVARGRVDSAAAMSTIASSTPAPSEPTEPTPEPTPEPEPTPTAPAPSTADFSGSLNAKQPQRSHSLLVGAGNLSAEMTTKNAPDMRLDIVAPDGTVVGSATGSTPMKWSGSVAAGTHTLRVTGTKGSYALTVTYVTP